MSIRKPIIKVTRKCSDCGGDGIDVRVINERHYGYRDCKRCRGWGRIDIKKNHPQFKKCYQKVLEKRIDNLTTEYRNAKAEASKIGEELGKHCKELDKVINS